MKVYSLFSSAYKNSCMTDDVNELVKYLGTLLQKADPRQTFIVKVEDIPTEIWLNQPLFEGFKPVTDIIDQDPY